MKRVRLCVCTVASFLVLFLIEIDNSLATDSPAYEITKFEKMFFNEIKKYARINSYSWFADHYDYEKGTCINVKGRTLRIHSRDDFIKWHKYLLDKATRTKIIETEDRELWRNGQGFVGTNEGTIWFSVGVHYYIEQINSKYSVPCN